jgi:hypothetical protein
MTSEPIDAVFGKFRNEQMTTIHMPMLLVKCQRCPHMFTFDVGKNGFGDLPERPNAVVLPKAAAKLKDLPCYESKGAPLEQRLLHIMLRAENWGAAERPENFPMWWPKDFAYHLSNFFHSNESPTEIEEALVQLQKDGTAWRTDGGWCVVEDED